METSPKCLEHSLSPSAQTGDKPDLLVSWAILSFCPPPWKARKQLVELVVSFHHVSSKSLTQVGNLAASLVTYQAISLALCPFFFQVSSRKQTQVVIQSYYQRPPSLTTPLFLCTTASPFSLPTSLLKCFPARFF